ncbi:MAG TPA: hypothetical protein VGK20_06660 [Candidatus Binatia bacterium]
MVDEFRTVPPGVGGLGGRPDLLRVALAAYAAHMQQRARVRIPRAQTPWGLSARIASIQRMGTR